MLSFFGQNRSCAAGVCFVEARYVNVGRDFNVSSFVWMHNMFVFTSSVLLGNTHMPAQDHYATL